MGIRMDQHMGLNAWASQLVRGEPVFSCTERVIRTFPDGRKEEFTRDVHESSVRKEESGRTYSGMFETEYPLSKYTFLDGRVYQEWVQAAPWSSGPVFFLALCDEEGNVVPESLWADWELDAA